jgi:restriction system protein
LVAELLKGMGYYVRLVAARGRDGGIDIVAYQDALGFASPRMKVQVKHRNSTMDVKEVREFNSLLRKEGDVGLIVSTGGFTSSALDEIRHSNYHIETMDLNRLIDLWQEHYSTIPQTGKALLPLQPVYFLALEI